METQKKIPRKSISGFHGNVVKEKNKEKLPEQFRLREASKPLLCNKGLLAISTQEAEINLEKKRVPKDTLWVTPVLKYP